LSSASGFQLVYAGTYWNIWATASYISEYGEYLTASLLSYPDTFVPQISKDFGYSIFPLKSGDSFDGIRMDLVLDPAAQGGAYTSTVFGSFGVSISPDSVYNSDGGLVGFYYYLLSLHETINVWTGTIASNWPWADDSFVWATSTDSNYSQFPNMCDFVILAEIEQTTASSIQKQAQINNPGVSALYKIEQEFGWAPYRKSFSLVRIYITNWAVYQEPLRSAILVYFLAVSGVGTELWNNLVSDGISIPYASILQAQSLFPELPQIFSSTPPTTQTKITITSVSNIGYQANGELLSLSAQLVDLNGKGISNKPVWFSYSIEAFVIVGERLTNNDGTATIIPVPLPTPFLLKIKASFNGDNAYAPSQSIIEYQTILKQKPTSMSLRIIQS
jgi:hypothetical protein